MERPSWSADLAGGKHVTGPKAAWVAPDPLKGDARVLIIGARVPEALPTDEVLAITTESSAGTASSLSDSRLGATY